MKASGKSPALPTFYSDNMTMASSFLVRFLHLCLLVLLTTTCSRGNSATNSGGQVDAGAAEVENRHQQPITLEVWAPAARWNYWRAHLPALAAERVREHNVVIKVNAFATSGDVYVQDLERSFGTDRAPDIALASTSQTLAWAQAGHLAPLDACIERYPEFGYVKEELWSLVSADGHTWGIPLNVEPRPLYFNKARLRDMGWTEAEVASLPERIRNRHFTLDDLLRTAGQAVAMGVVAPGFAYWPDPGRNNDLMMRYLAYAGYVYSNNQDEIVVVKTALRQAYVFQQQLVERQLLLPNLVQGGELNTWTSRLVWRDTIAAGRTLFWHGATSDWAQLLADYVEGHDKESRLSATFGLALHPAGGSDFEPVVHMNATFYVVIGKPALNSARLAAACAVLAQTVVPEINAINAIESASLGVFEDQAEPAEYISKPFTAAAAYMFEYGWHLRGEPEYSQYFDILEKYMLSVQKGSLTPVEATDAAIRELEREIAGIVVID